MQRPPRPAWGAPELCSHHISSSGPSLYFAPFCLAISMPMCTERERERSFQHPLHIQKQINALLQKGR